MFRTPTAGAPVAGLLVNVLRSRVVHNLGRCVGQIVCGPDGYQHASTAHTFRVVFGVALRDAGFRKTSDQTAGCGAYPGARQSRRDRASCDHRTKSGNRQRHQARYQAQSAAYGRAGSGPSGHTFADLARPAGIILVFTRFVASDDANLIARDTSSLQIRRGTLCALEIVK